MSIAERFRENHPEGRELWCWYSDYNPPYWQTGAWIVLDQWGLGVEYEVDPGGCWDGAERRQFLSLSIGPVHFVVTRVTAVK